jgi:hypothetical protein
LKVGTATLLIPVKKKSDQWVKDRIVY